MIGVLCLHHQRSKPCLEQITVIVQEIQDASVRPIMPHNQYTERVHNRGAYMFHYHKLDISFYILLSSHFMNNPIVYAAVLMHLRPKSNLSGNPLPGSNEQGCDYHNT